MPAVIRILAAYAVSIPCLMVGMATAHAASPAHDGWVGAWGFAPTSFTPTPAATAPAAACPNASWATYPSAYGTLGFCGGDGKFGSGTESWVLSENSTLTDDLNQSSAFYGYTTNSPAQGFPGWNFVDGYSPVDSQAAFGTNGFGSLTITNLANSEVCINPQSKHSR